MDNAAFHKRVQKLLNRHGHRLLFLPPYSPDLNPIEKKWAQVKFLRQGWMENDLSKLFYDVHPKHNSFVVQWLYGPLAPSGLPSSNNPPIVSICSDIEGKNKKARKKVAFLEEKFQQPLLVDYEDDASYETHFQLRTLLDTRFNGLEQEKKFQIFSVTNHIQKDMYLIQDQDIYSIQKLIKPAEAIDHYAAHLLSRQAGEFDFLKYAEDF